MHRAPLARAKLLPGRGQTLEPSPRAGLLERLVAPPGLRLAACRRAAAPTYLVVARLGFPVRVDRLPSPRLTVRTPDCLPPTDRFPRPPPPPSVSPLSSEPLAPTWAGPPSPPSLSCSSWSHGGRRRVWLRSRGCSRRRNRSATPPRQLHSHRPGDRPSESDSVSTGSQCAAGWLSLP
jgi:hypothetical protein